MAHPIKPHPLPIVITSVWGTGPRSVWAVVDDGTVLRYNGKKWRGAAIHPMGKAEALWGSGPSDIYLVGGSSIMRHDGKRWSPMDHSFCKDDMARVSVNGQDRVQAVSNRGRLYRHDGKTWSAGLSVPIGHRIKHVFRIKLPKGTLNHQGRPYLNRFITTFKHLGFSVWTPANKTWRAVKLPPRAEKPLHDVWSSPRGGLVAVGKGGVSFHHDGKAWRPVKTNSKAWLFSVWGSSERNALAVGSEGTVLRFNGKRWRKMRLPRKVGKFSLKDLPLLGVWGSGPRDIHVVGVLGIILHYDGRRWRVVPSGTGRTLYAVWGSGPRDVYAVGDGGVVLHFDGKAWRAMDSGTSYDLFDVAGSSPENVYVAGKKGTILHLGPR